MNKLSFTLLASSVASAALPQDIVITPYATEYVDISQSYHKKLLRNIMNIIKSPANGDCASLNVKYYLPEIIPADYSKLGSVSFNFQRAGLVDYTVKNGGNVVYVASLSACGKYENEPSVSGCASSGNAATIEISGDAKKDAMALLHEIGHSMGLAGGSPATDARRTYVLNGVQQTDSAHLNDEKRLMFYQLAGGTRLSKEDCAAYLTSNELFRRDSSPSAILLADAETSIATELVEAGSSSSTLLQLLEQVWLHEPPILALKEAIETSGGLSEIREIIVSDRSPTLWKNALVALGYFGVESDISLVRYFLSRSLPIPDGRERVVTDAKEAASFSLGILIGRYASLEGAAFAFAITSQQQLPPGEVAEYAGVDLSGLSAKEQSLAQALVLQQTVIAQEIAFGVIDPEGQSSLIDQSAAFADAFEEARGGQRSSDLIALGLDPSFVENLSELNERVGEFRRGEVGVPFETLDFAPRN